MYMTLESGACGGITSTAVSLIKENDRVVFISGDGDATHALNRSWGSLDPRRKNISIYMGLRTDNEFLNIIDYVVNNIDEIDVLIVDSLTTLASPAIRNAVEKQLRDLFTFKRDKKAIVGKNISVVLDPNNLQAIGRATR